MRLSASNNAAHTESSHGRQSSQPDWRDTRMPTHIPASQHTIHERSARARVNSFSPLQIPSWAPRDTNTPLAAAERAKPLGWDLGLGSAYSASVQDAEPPRASEPTEDAQSEARLPSGPLRAEASSRESAALRQATRDQALHAALAQTMSHLALHAARLPGALHDCHQMRPERQGSMVLPKLPYAQEDVGRHASRHPPLMQHRDSQQHRRSQYSAVYSAVGEARGAQDCWPASPHSERARPRDLPSALERQPGEERSGPQMCAKPAVGPAAVHASQRCDRMPVWAAPRSPAPLLRQVWPHASALR